MTSVINRYYDPTTDQYLSIDPAVTQTNQPYVFTNDNPLNATDPLGLAPKPKRLTPGERTAIDNKEMGMPYDKKAYNSAQKKATTNEKVGYSPDGTVKLPSPSRGSSGSETVRRSSGGSSWSTTASATASTAGRVAMVAGGVGATWWLLKIASPLCGPAIVFCAVFG